MNFLADSKRAPHSLIQTKVHGVSRTWEKIECLFFFLFLCHNQIRIASNFDCMIEFRKTGDRTQCSLTIRTWNRSTSMQKEIPEKMASAQSEGTMRASILSYMVKSWQLLYLNTMLYGRCCLVCHTENIYTHFFGIFVTCALCIRNYLLSKACKKDNNNVNRWHTHTHYHLLAVFVWLLLLVFRFWIICSETALIWNMAVSKWSQNKSER